jgi:maltose O-acetyltransferase
MARVERLIAALVRIRHRLDRARVASRYARRGIEAVNDRLLTAYRVEARLAEYGAHIGRDVVVHGPLIVHNAERDYAKLTVADHAHVGRLAVLDLAGSVVVERHATVSMGVTILTHTDVGESPLRERLPRSIADTRIGEASYIGANATILAGCHVGRRAVVGASALVNRPVPDGATVAGVPARPVGDASSGLS